MRVLVTGGRGMIGRYVVRELVRSGHEVTSLSRSRGDDLPCRHLLVDLTDAGSVYQAVAKTKPDAVVHMGAWSTNHMVVPTRTYVDNVEGTFNLFQACADMRVMRIVNASSGQVYGFEKLPPVYLPADEEHPLRPLNPYALAKIALENAAEYFVEQYGMTILSFRIMGTRSPDRLPTEIEALARNPEGDNLRLWTRCDSRDCAIACRLAIEKADIPSGPYNITGCVPLVEETMELLNRYIGDRTEFRETIVGHASPLSCAKAESVLGFKPKYPWSESRSFPDE